MSNTTAPFVSRALPSLRQVFRPTFWLGGNWKRLIESSELPSEIKSLVRQVVSKSRLMRREKYDVAEELIQHFQDGNQRGLSFDLLTKNFGNAESAALLIRRSKIRNRSLVVSAARIIPPTMLCFSIAYLILLWEYHNGESNPSVDYTSELNQRVTETEEKDKAWPLYRPAWLKFQLIDGARRKYSEMRKSMFVQDQKTDRKRLTKPSDDQWPQTVSMLKAHDELLDVSRKGAKRESFGLALRADPSAYSDEDFATLFPNAEKTNFESYEQEHDPDGILEGGSTEILLPHVQEIRKVARLLHLDTRLAILEGDSDRVVGNVEAVLGLANQIADTPILVNALVAGAVGSIGFNQLEEVITTDPEFLSQAKLARLQKHLEQLNIRSWLDYKGEHLLIQDMVQRCYTDDGNGDGQITAAGMRFLNSGYLSGLDRNSEHAFENNGFVKFARSAMAPTSLFTCATRKEVLGKADEIFDQIAADQELPFWESRNSKIDGWKDIDGYLKEHQTEHVLLYRVMPSVKQVRNVIERTCARKNGVILALAMHRFHARHQKWPKSASDLSPKYLKEIPIDILTGKPLHFKVVDDQSLVYSVGLDHDDDGGVDATKNRKRIERSDIKPGPKDAEFEGDWILWPQVIPGGNSIY
jgi:hypothetical protein